MPCSLAVRSALSRFSIGDPDDFEAGFFVGGQMRVVDDSSGADYADPVVHALRQFRFVIEMRKDFSHFEILIVRCNGKL